MSITAQRADSLTLPTSTPTSHTWVRQSDRSMWLSPGRDHLFSVCSWVITEVKGVGGDNMHLFSNIRNPSWPFLGMISLTKIFNASHNIQNKAQILTKSFKDHPRPNHDLILTYFSRLSSYYNKAHIFLTLLDYSLLSQHIIISHGFPTGNVSLPLPIPTYQNPTLSSKLCTNATSSLTLSPSMKVRIKGSLLGGNTECTLFVSSFQWNHVGG